MTGTNLAAISQAWPWPGSQHAVSQMKGVVKSQVHKGEDESVRVRAALSPRCIKQS